MVPTPPSHDAGSVVALLVALVLLNDTLPTPIGTALVHSSFAGITTATTDTLSMYQLSSAWSPSARNRRRNLLWSALAGRVWLYSVKVVGLMPSEVMVLSTCHLSRLL